MPLSQSTVLLVACYLIAGGDAASDRVGDRPVIVSTVPRNWFVAREVCISYGKTLLEIHTAEENLEAESLLEKYQLESAWIGGNDLGEEDQYQWPDGKKVLNQFWAPGSWDNKGGGQDCVAITSREKCQPDNAWMGASDMDDEDQCHYPGRNWPLNQSWTPAWWDDKGKDCVPITSSEKYPKNWYDRECRNKYAFICQDSLE